MNPDKYRHLSLPWRPAEEHLADAAVGALNDSFDADDFHVTRNGGKLDIRLRQLDVEAFTTILRSVDAAHPAALPIDEISTAVASVRSFGISGRKRLYVGYNRERKVANRQSKVARRGRHFYANDGSFHEITRASRQPIK